MILYLFSSNNKQKHFFFPHKKAHYFFTVGAAGADSFCGDGHGFAMVEGPE